MTERRVRQGYCRLSGNGGPQTCLPVAHGVALQARPYGPSSPTSIQDPREADDTRPPREWPHQASSRGAERSMQGTSRGARDASRDDRDQAGAGPRSVLVFSLVQRGQAQAWSTEASGKDIHFGVTRPRPSQRQEGSHRGAQEGVTTKAFDRRGPT